MRLPLSPFFLASLLSLALGFGAGVIGTALTSSSLAEYALSLGALSSPARLSDEFPRAAPSTYADAVREVSESVLPGVVTLYPAGSFASPIGAGAVLTSDGWLMTSREFAPLPGSTVAVVDGKTYPISKMVEDPSTTVVFLKVDASNLPVLAFGSGFELAPGEQLFVATSPRALYAAAAVEARWPVGAVSSDVPARRVVIDHPWLGEYPGAPVANARVELVGLVLGSGSGVTEALPLDGVLPAFNAMLRGGEPARASLGVSATDLSRALGLPVSETRGFSHGALVALAPRKGSAAASAGISAGDVILAVDGTPVDARRSLDDLVSTRAPGDQVTLRVSSAEGEREVRVTLGAL